MSVEVDTVVRHLGKIWQLERLVLIDMLFASDCLGHIPAVEIQGREGLKQLLSALRSAFPDLQVTVQDRIAEGDRLVTRWTALGTHRGEFQGIAATGRQARVVGMSIARIAAGKVVEYWTSWDALGLLQQLGVEHVPEGSAG